MTSDPKRYGIVLQGVFLRGAFFLLLITAGAKLVSTYHPIPLLFVPDSVFPLLSKRQVLATAAVLELVVALLIVISANTQLKLAGTAWLSFLFLTYRLGLLLSHAPAYCPCLGTLGQDLGLSPQFVSGSMLAASIALFLGSSLGLASARLCPST